VVRISVTATLVCLVACAVFLGLSASESVAQRFELATKVGPDLVVQEIIIREEGTEEFHSARVQVKVRNRGGADAGRSVTALIYSNNVAGGATVLTETTPAIPRGAIHDAEFVIEGIAGNLSGMLLGVADAPVAASPTGQVTEGARLMMMSATQKRTDLNNTFGVIFSTQGRALPLRFQNPLFQ